MDTTVDESATATTQQSWSVNLSISGGFAGLMRNISLDQTGLAVLVDKKTSLRVEKQISPQDLQAIAKLIEDLPAGKFQTNRSSQCRDCMTYALLAKLDGVKRYRTIEDIQLPDSDAQKLISMLTDLASTMYRQ